MSAGQQHTNAKSHDLSTIDGQDNSHVAPSLFAPGRPVPNLEMWVLVRKLGGGGFGEVWLAQHQRKGLAAVKFCTDLAARHQLVTYEKAVVARVMKHSGDHPNIVPLLECNLTGDIPWLMYEYVEGGTLAETITEWKKLSPPRRLGRAVRVLNAITNALGKFHRLKPPLVHRDLKPQNVLMAGRTPRITDFGVGGAAIEAGRTDKPEEGSATEPVPTILRTAASSRYASPEQRFGSTPSPRDDVFALGIIAYQLIRGDLEADPDPNVERELRAMRIPAELTSLILESIALDPARRPKDANEWESRLTALLRRKTAARRDDAPHVEDMSDDSTEQLEAMSEADVSAVGVSQTITIASRGRWYSRPADKVDAEWKLVAATPADVRITPGEVYRFSIHTGANEEIVNAIGAIAGLSSLCSLNLSYCAGVTDAGLALLAAFPGLRQLYLRGCANISDAGLSYLHALTKLQTLELTDCPQLTEMTVKSLQALLRECKVQR